MSDPLWDEELGTLVTRVVDVFGEPALQQAIGRVLDSALSPRSGELQPTGAPFAAALKAELQRLLRPN